MLNVFNCQNEDDLQIEVPNEPVSIKEYPFNDINNRYFKASYSKIIDGIKNNEIVLDQGRGENNFIIDSTSIKEIKKRQYNILYIFCKNR